MAPRAYVWFQRVVLLVWVAGTAWLVWSLLYLPQQRYRETGGDYVVEIGPQPTFEAVAAVLVKEQIIRHPRAWVFYMRIISDESALRRPTLVLNKAHPPHSLAARIVKNRGRATVSVLIPEGFTQFDVAKRLERFGIASQVALLQSMTDPLLLAALGIPGASAEGYLFPAYYSLDQDSEPRSVVRRLATTAYKRMRPWYEAYVRAQSERALPVLTQHELVTLASIVEREARVAEERPIIAGVFLNRLRDPSFRPHRLQADPTVGYGCLVAKDSVETCREFDGRRITPAMVRDAANPYNTYRREGLPPGPICNPGMSALEAAANPAAHEWFYFVTKGGGRHAFSRTLDEHNANIRVMP